MKHGDTYGPHEKEKNIIVRHVNLHPIEENMFSSRLNYGVFSKLGSLLSGISLSNWVT